jgi:hypothetical protein
MTQETEFETNVISLQTTHRYGMCPILTPMYFLCLEYSDATRLPKTIKIRKVVKQNYRSRNLWPRLPTARVDMGKACVRSNPE